MAHQRDGITAKRKKTQNTESRIEYEGSRDGERVNNADLTYGQDNRIHRIANSNRNAGIPELLDTTTHSK